MADSTGVDVGASGAGRHAGDAGDGGAWWQRMVVSLLEILIVCFEFRERCLKVIDRKIRGINRKRRKITVRLMALGTALLVIFVSTAMLDGDLHDARVAESRPVVQATMLGEDPDGCAALIQLDGIEHQAVTSCGQISFAPGETVWVAQDPAEAGRYLVVVAGEDWFRPNAVDRMIWIAVGLFLGLMGGLAGFLILLRRDAPIGRGPGKPRILLDGSVGRARQERDESFLARAEARWVGFKERVGRRLKRISELDIRLRGTLMSLSIITVIWVVATQTLGLGAEIARDQAVVRSGPVIDVVLIDFAIDDYPPVVRHASTRVPLAYDLRSGEGEELGDAVQVVVDPIDETRLIPASVARQRGLFTWFHDYGFFMVFGAAVLGFAGWLLIPREVGDVFSALMRRLGLDD